MAYGALTQYGSTALSNVTLPDKIKCVRCRVIKGPGAFAANRQKDLKEKIKSDPRFNATANPGFIVCLSCTQVNGNVVELLCNGCNKVKGKDAFSKAQRRNPDKAECWPCLEARLNTEPGGESDDDSSGSGGESSDNESDDSTYGGTRTVTNTLNNLSVGERSVGAASDSGYGMYSSGVDDSSGGAPLSSRAPSVTDSVATNGTPFIPPHLRKKAPSSVAGSNISTTSNFAKIRAAPQKIKMDAAQRVRDQDKAAEDDICVAASESDSD